MRIDVVTLFPEAFAGFSRASFVARAQDQAALVLGYRNPRDFGLGKHRAVDDTPYGGGSGMVMRVDVLVACLESFDPRSDDEVPRAHRVLMTPQGAPLDQAKVEALAARPWLALVCGRYEGFDERVRAHVDEEISLGDFVMTGGEVAAMAIIDAVVRLLPGVLGNATSTKEESHAPSNEGLLEYPQFTRPAEFRGRAVPEVLTGGDHAAIARFRKEQAIERTRNRRPDLHARWFEATRGAREAEAARVAAREAKKAARRRGT